MRNCLALMGICLCIGYLPADAELQTANVLANKRVELKSVQSKISESTKNLGQLHEQQQSVQQQLAEIDKQYSQLLLSLKNLQQEVDRKKRILMATKLAITTQQERIDNQKRSLAGQVNAAYRIGRQDRLKLLLNQEDLTLSSRILVYYDYLNKVRSQKVAQIDRDVKQLVQLETQQVEDNFQLSKMLKQKQAEQELLLETKQQRAVLLSQLNKKYLSGREALSRLQNDERQLRSLLDVLQREEERQRLRVDAEVTVKNDAEARSKESLFERRQENSGRPDKLTDRKYVRDERKITAEVKQSAEQDQKASFSNDLNKRAAKKAKTEVEPVVSGKSFSELRGHLPWPVRGRMLKTYGSSRFEGRWDGVLIGAGAGQEVRAVAGGRVVYAAWLRSYGLLTIVNHGNGYMTVYAFNESLYKDVGANVKAGEVIASVGQSGGQSEPGLYFEIRQQGKPLDPGRWCKK